MAGPGWNVNLEQGAIVGAVAMAATWIMARVSFYGGLRAFEARTEERFEAIKAAMAQHQASEERNAETWRKSLSEQVAQVGSRIDDLYALLPKMGGPK